MAWSNGDQAHVTAAFFTADNVRGETPIDEESLELRFFPETEIPPLVHEDHMEAMKAWRTGARHPLQRKNREDGKTPEV